MDKNKQLLIILILILFLIDYSFFNFLGDEKETAVVSRVIDGDTIVINENSVRLMGINAPERGDRDYLKSKEFLENLILNKSVELEYYGKDRYDRELAYVFIDTKNMNVELVRKGFANIYLLDERKYEEQLRDAWKDCINNNENLCEKSRDKCVDCIKLKKFDVEREEIIFYNRCSFDCDLNGWEIKDEGRKNFVFDDFVLKGDEQVKIIVGEGKDSNDVLFWKRKDYVWTDSGDTLFLRDDAGKLVLYSSY